MITPYWEARFSLVIRGEDLPFEELEKTLNLKSTRIVHKGDMISRLPEVRAEYDEWFHTIQLTTPDEEDHELNELVECICNMRPQLHKLSEKYELVMKLYNRSDKAIIAYRLMPETLKKLAETGLPLDVTSLSWGDIGI